MNGASLIWNNNPGFEFNSDTEDNDFIILKLNTPIDLNKPDVQAACLPPSSNYLQGSSTEDKCYTSGWGALSWGKF